MTPSRLTNFGCFCRNANFISCMQYTFGLIVFPCGSSSSSSTYDDPTIWITKSSGAELLSGWHSTGCQRFPTIYVVVDDTFSSSVTIRLRNGSLLCRSEVSCSWTCGWPSSPWSACAAPKHRGVTHRQIIANVLEGWINRCVIHIGYSYLHNEIRQNISMHRSRKCRIFFSGPRSSFVFVEVIK